MRLLRAVALCLLTTPHLLAAQAPTAQTQTDQWNGYVRQTFQFEGRQCYAVEPKTPAPGKPWLWRARFWGHRPEVDLALLDKGFHLVYMDVVEMLGNQEAVEHWNHFYDLVTGRYGLAPKVALEGMSRGGLYVYSWGSANPTKVAAIYADAPVCDITTWPMTGPDGTFSATGWKLLTAAFGFKTPEDARAYKGNPIDILEPLARAKVPLLHVVGDADDVVPVARNTAVLAQRYKALGGEITVIHKPGIGHVHGLDDPTPIIQFLLRNTVGPK
jgi:pimeloyl-ACP methyl ester carboxylesterase